MTTRATASRPSNAGRMARWPPPVRLPLARRRRSVHSAPSPRPHALSATVWLPIAPTAARWRCIWICPVTSSPTQKRRSLATSSDSAAANKGHLSMRNTLIGTLTAIVCALILFGAQVAALQDDSFIIRTENHTGTQSRWLLQALSDHPDAPQWGLSVSAHPNSSCPDGNPEHDLVYQLGANAAANGTSVLDPRWAALTLNWESLWCNISGQRMSEFQIRAITPSGARIRPLHIEVIHDTGKVNIAYQADWMSFGMPGAQILSITPGRLTLQNGARRHASTTGRLVCRLEWHAARDQTDAAGQSDQRPNRGAAGAIWSGDADPVILRVSCELDATLSV